MSRRAARITHDEVCRMVKAVRACGLSIGRVTFDGERIDIIVDSGESGDITIRTVDERDPANGLIREPQP